jgi:hypothetical protein
MQELSTPKIPENVGLSRRRYLAGAVAVPVAVIAPVAIKADEEGGHYDELIMLLDHRKEPVARARLSPQYGDWPPVKAKDYSRATSALNAQPLTRQDWEVRSSYRTAHTECKRLLGEVVEVERCFFRAPVLSFRDLRLKIDLAFNDDWLLGEDDRRVAQLSISLVADGDGCPDRRRDRAGEVVAP